MEQLPLAYALAGALTVGLVLVSRPVRELPGTGPQLGLLAGVLAGPHVLGLLQVSEELRDPLLLEASRLLLAVSLIGVALRFPVSAVRARLRPVLWLVLLVMPLAAVVTGGLAVLVLGLPVALAALLGACLCPTDPVLASDVVTGGPAERDLPEETRVVLSEESGANDGLALPLVLLALAPVLGDAVGGRTLEALYQVAVAVVVGAGVGRLVAALLARAERRGDVEGPSQLVLTLLLAVTVLGVVRLLRGDAVLAVFVAGLVFSGSASERDRASEDGLDEVANRYAVVPYFVLLGVVLPVGAWADLGWPLLTFTVAVLLLRRPPVVLALGRLLRLRPPDRAVVAWFGPVGVSALLYVTLAAERGARDPRLLAAATAVVAGSVLVHGATTVPGRALRRRA